MDRIYGDLSLSSRKAFLRAVKDSASVISSWDGRLISSDRSAVLVSSGSLELLCVERRRLGGERLPVDGCRCSPEGPAIESLVLPLINSSFSWGNLSN